jgi:hypothetical protein
MYRNLPICSKVPQSPFMRQLRDFSNIISVSAKKRTVS